MQDQNTASLCLCGRELVPHCPCCGSRQTYALASKVNYVTRTNGVTYELKVHRCRRCGNVFNDDDWRFRCAAPPERLGRPVKATRVAPAQSAEVVAEGLAANPDVIAVMEKWRKKLQGE